MPDGPTIATQRERRFLIEHLLELLTFNAKSPDRIGRRVMVMDHVLQMRADTAPKSKVLARRLKVSEARISVALTHASQALDSILKS